MHGNFSPPRNRLSPHHRVSGPIRSRNGLVRYRAQIQLEPLTQKSSDPSLLAVKVRMGLSGRGRFAGREKPETHTSAYVSNLCFSHSYTARCSSIPAEGYHSSGAFTARVAAPAAWRSSPSDGKRLTRCRFVERCQNCSKPRLDLGTPLRMGEHVLLVIADRS